MNNIKQLIYPSSLNYSENEYYICDCSGIKTGIIKYLDTLSNKEIEEKLTPYFNEKTYLKGTIGIVIDYLRRYSPNTKNRETYYEDQMYYELILPILKFLLTKQDICLYEYLYTYIKIPRFNGDYLSYIILNYLNNTPVQSVIPKYPNNKDTFTCHGSGIRCSFLNIDKDFVKEITKHL